MLCDVGCRMFWEYRILLGCSIVLQCRIDLCFIVRFTILHILFYTLGLTNSSTTGVPRRRHS